MAEVVDCLIWTGIISVCLGALTLLSLIVAHNQLTTKEEDSNDFRRK